MDELPVLLAFLGDLRGRTVLDFGCASPRITAHIVAAGADYTGLAPDERRQVAAEKSGNGSCDVRVTDLDRWSGHDLSAFDVVVACRSPQYLRNIARLLETLHHHVTSGGRLVFSVDHPFVTAGQDPGGYFLEGERPAYRRWAGRTAWHRSFETYVRELRYCGFQLVELSEGLPDGSHERALALCTPQWAVFRCVRTP